MALVTCPCAFRLRRLAKNAGPGRCARHFPCKFPHKNGSCEIARATLSSLWACQIALAVALCPFWDASRNLLVTLGLSRRSRCGTLLIWMVKEILRRDLDKEVSYTELAQRSCTESSYRDLVQRCTEILTRGLLQRSCQKSSYRKLVQCYRDLFKLEESCQELSYRDLVHRSYTNNPLRTFTPTRWYQPLGRPRLVKYWLDLANSPILGTPKAVSRCE